MSDFDYLEEDPENAGLDSRPLEDSEYGAATSSLNPDHQSHELMDFDRVLKLTSTAGGTIVGYGLAGTPGAVAGSLLGYILGRSENY